MSDPWVNAERVNGWSVETSESESQPLMFTLPVHLPRAASNASFVHRDFPARRVHRDVYPTHTHSDLYTLMRILNARETSAMFNLSGSPESTNIQAFSWTNCFFFSVSHHNSLCASSSSNKCAKGWFFLSVYIQNCLQPCLEACALFL